MPFALKKLMAAVSDPVPVIISFSGDTTTLSWVTEHATNVSISGIGSVALSGSMANPYSPPGAPYNGFTISYTLSASGGVTVTAQVNIYYPSTYAWYCPHVPGVSQCAGYNGS